MSNSNQKKEKNTSQINRNEEYIDALQAERARLEDEEYELELCNRRLLRVTCESEGWKGLAARQFNSQQESELQETFASGRKEFARRYDTLSDSISELKKENENLRKEMKQKKEEQ